MMETAALEAATGRRVLRMQPLHGGCIGEVYRAALDDGRVVVAKTAAEKSGPLDLEGKMLRYLAEHSMLPVPAVLHAAPSLLVMEWIPGSSHFDASAEAHAAELLAQLHGVRAERFGLEFDTLIGGLHQPNTQTDSWVEFFAEQRLLHRACEAERAGRLSPGLRRKLGALAEKLPRLLPEPPHPSLLHGDVWTTNVLASEGRITGFLDPAIYYGHPEMELAFTTLFGTFGRPFFARYNEIRPIAPGFFEERRDLYNLYPLLVHVQLFGGGYAAQVEGIVARYL
jgi:fructosamine-3-kinase